MERIEVYQHTAAGPVVVDCDGVLDGRCALRLWNELASALWRRSSRLVIDLSSVEYVDTEVLGVIAETNRRAASLGGWVRLVAPPAVTWKLLRSTRIHRAVPVFRTVHAATHDTAAGLGNATPEPPRPEGV